MKKLLLTCLFSVICFSVYAQTSQGDWFIGGSIRYSDFDFGESGSKSFNIGPSFGTFVSNSVAVGLSIGYSSDKSEVTSYSYPSNLEYKITDKSKRYTIAPFVRKYWNIVGGLSFYGEASLPVSFGNNKKNYTTSADIDISEFDSKEDVTSVSMVLAPGFEYRINNWLSIDTQLSLFNLTYNKVSPEEGDKSTTFSINGDTNQTEIGDLTIGIKFFF